ncbi:MAG: hypothetical protein ACLR7Y_03800, partial [Dysosmobacter sp.]
SAGTTVGSSRFFAFVNRSFIVPYRMRTCPSLFMMFTFLKTAFFPLRKKTSIFQQRAVPLAKK